MMMGGGEGWGKTSDNPAINAKPDKKVFVGNLMELGKEGLSKELNKKLCEHFKQAGVCKYAEIGKTGKGTAVFGTREDATKAVEMLNGSVFEGCTIVVKAWTDRS